MPCCLNSWQSFFFFNDTATTEIYTLSLHDALPISDEEGRVLVRNNVRRHPSRAAQLQRSEEHTSELQSPCNLVCRLLLEKKKTTAYAFSRSVRAMKRSEQQTSEIQSR